MLTICSINNNITIKNRVGDSVQIVSNLKPNEVLDTASDDSITLCQFYHKMTINQDVLYDIIRHFDMHPRIQVIYTDERINNINHHYYNIDTSVRNYIINPTIFIRGSCKLRFDDKILHLHGFDIIHQAISNHVLIHHIPIITASYEDKRIVSENMKVKDIQYAFSRYHNK